jgi:CO/xanthine dehydrogenase Mo-binding subunit
MAVGQNVNRKEGIEKLTGAARYVDDIAFDNMLHGLTVRSTVARGCIRAINFDLAFDWSQVVVADHRDIPGDNFVALIENDQPLLAVDHIRHAEEPILLIAAESRAIAYEAARHIKIEYEELPPILSIKEALAPSHPIYGSDNIFKRFLISRGDINEGFRSADRIVEGEYHVPHQEQLYIEPQGVIAATNETTGEITVMGSLQCPYYIHKALKQLFQLPDEKVIVIQTATGGGFGGKEEYPSVIAAHAALLAHKAKRPVKMIYDRAEDIAATTKRHPGIIRHRTGVAGDGRIVACDIDIVLDGGAYVTLSPVVLSRAAIHALGPYRCDNVRIAARAVATNTPPNGAFRGFGAPQVAFAYEMQIERIAAELNIEPLEIRRRNMVRAGDITATGQKLRWSVGSDDVLDAVLERSGYEQKRRTIAEENSCNAESNKRRGVGLSFFFHGAGFTGSGEAKMKARAGVEVTADGVVRVLSGSTEIGQGTRTIFAQIVAEELGIDYADVEIADPDTSRVPDSGPTVASRTCMVVGRVIQLAAREIREKLRRNEPLPLHAEVEYQSPPGVVWDDATYTGDAYPAFSWGAEVAEVEVNLDTYETTVLKITTAQDLGRAIHPILAAGQIEGGTLQAIGYGLMEELVWDRGRIVNNRLTNYIIPTALDAPEIEAIIIEKEYPHGPFGAKGVGELPMNGAAPAICAAIFHATGALLSTIPATPERLMAALDETKDNGTNGK